MLRHVARQENKVQRLVRKGFKKKMTNINQNEMHLKTLTAELPSAKT